MSYLKSNFKYKEDAYEYETDINPIDMINGTDRLRHWYEEKGSNSFLDLIEKEDMSDFMMKRAEVLLY